jgi:hypothetical protein
MAGACSHQQASGQERDESLDTAMVAVAGLLLPVIGWQWT